MRDPGEYAQRDSEFDGFKGAPVDRVIINNKASLPEWLVSLAAVGGIVLSGVAIGQTSDSQRQLAGQLEEMQQQSEILDSTAAIQSEGVAAADRSASAAELLLDPFYTVNGIADAEGLITGTPYQEIRVVNRGEADRAELNSITYLLVGADDNDPARRDGP